MACIPRHARLPKAHAASSAIQDRLLHRGHLLKFEGKSYRLKEAALRLTEAKQRISGWKRNKLGPKHGLLVGYLPAVAWGGGF